MDDKFFSEANDLAIGLFKIELSYRETQRKYDSEVNRLTLETNWTEVNDKRIEKGYPKISNDSQRKAYIKQKSSSLKQELDEIKSKYHFYKNVVEMVKYND